MQKATDNLNQQPQRGFTLTELLVVLAVVAFLAVTLLPALAMTQGDSKLAQCLANHRKIGAACAMYADDLNGWYPIVSLGAVNNYAFGSVNQLEAIYYACYVYFPDSLQDGVVMPRFIQPSISSQEGFQDQNLGYLYADGLIGDGHAIFCPGFSVADTNASLYSLSANYYSNPQFMSTAGRPGSGFYSIRSSYMFNPRLVNAYGYPTSSDILRRYQKTSDVKPRDVFTVDDLFSTQVQIGLPFSPDNWPHWPYKGLPVGFTDGSAKFCGFNTLYFNAIVKYLDGGDDKTSAIEFDQIFDALRDSP